MAPSLVLAALVGGVLALVLGLPLMRLSGLAAGIATFAVLEITHNVLREWTKIGPGATTLSLIPESNGALQPVIGVLIIIAIAYAYQRSRLGRMLRASREDAAAAEAVGVNVHRQRLWAFTLSGALAGFAGGLYVHILGSITADSVYLELTFLTLAMLVFGGATSLWGAVLGALVVSALDSFLSQAESGVNIGFTFDLPQGTRLIILGAVMATMLILRPSGITGGREFSLPCGAAPRPDAGGPPRKAPPHEDLHRRLRRGRVAVRGQSRDARRRRGVGLRPLAAARGRDRASAACACAAPATCTAAPARHERPGGAAALRARHRRDQGHARRVRDRRDRARLRRRRRGLRHERRRQRGGARAPRPARDPRHDLPGREGARAGRRAVGRQGRHDVRAVRAAAGDDAEEVERLADACTRAGMPAHAVADARPAQWRKVIFNAASNPLGALTGLTHGRVCERPDLRALVSGLIDEGKAVASAQGITLDADPEALIDHAARPEVAYDHKASMLQDVEARRRTEIDYLNGGIVSFGARLGVPTPLNETIAALIRGIEAVLGDDLMDLAAELERRYANTRAAMAQHDLDALIVSGSEYSGFEGGVTYLSGFQIVHRYAYVIVPADGEPFIVFPTEARYVGEHGTTALEQVFADRPGAEIAARATRRGLEAHRRLRARLHHERARPLGPRGPRSRALRRRVRPLARRQEQGRAGVGARLRAHQPARLRGLLRGLRAGPQRGRGDGRRRGLLRQRGLRPADHEHGADRPRPQRAGAARVQDRARGGDPRRLPAALARGRRARACTGSRSRAPSARRTRR